MLSPAAAEPDPLAFEQWFTVVELTVHESSVAPVVLSMTARSTVSVPVTVAFESAYRLVTVAPFSGVGPARRVLSAKPLVFVGQLPDPDLQASGAPSMRRAIALL